MSTKERQQDQLRAICAAMKGLYTMPKTKDNHIMVEREIKQLSLQKFQGIEPIIEQTQRCDKVGHKQQVAYSTYQTAFTQICFTCATVRTNVNLSETY